LARSRAKDYEEKQRSILETAAGVFANLGMEKASMAEIARQGRISKALLYHYYPSKDELLFDIVRSHLEDLDDALTSADRPDRPPAERLRMLICAVLEQYKDADDRHKVQLNHMAALSAEQTERIRTLERRIVRRFATIIDQINPALSGRNALLMPVTMSLFGILNWVYMWFREDGPVTRDDYAEVVTTLILQGVRALGRPADG